MTEYHLFLVFALGMLTTGACLTLHCFFMFMALLVVSTFLQIGIWAALVILPRGRRFEREDRGLTAVGFLGLLACGLRSVDG